MATSIIASTRIDLIEIDAHGNIQIRFLKRLHNPQTGQVEEGWHRTTIDKSTDIVRQLRGVNEALKRDLGLPPASLKVITELGKARRNGKRGKIFERDRVADRLDRAWAQAPGIVVPEDEWDAAVERAFPERKVRPVKKSDLPNFTDADLATLIEETEGIEDTEAGAQSRRAAIEAEMQRAAAAEESARQAAREAAAAERAARRAERAARQEAARAAWQAAQAEEFAAQAAASEAAAKAEREARIAAAKIANDARIAAEEEARQQLLADMAAAAEARRAAAEAEAHSDRAGTAVGVVE